MAKATEGRTYEEALAWLREHGFDVTDAPRTRAGVFRRKYIVPGAIQGRREGGVMFFAYPGYLMGAEISKLVTRGYKQFLKPSKNGGPGSAELLKALQLFSEELRVLLARPSL